MPSNLGMTIFEHMMQQAALEKQQEREDQLRRDQNQQLMNQKLQEALDYKLSREDKDFDRQLKIAELYGKLGSQEGRGTAPKMTSPRLQEMADVSYGLEQQRIPTEQREMEAVKLPLQQEITERENVRTNGRRQIEGMKTDRAREMAGYKSELAAYDRELRSEIEGARIAMRQAELDYKKGRDAKMDPAILAKLQADAKKAQQAYNDKSLEGLTKLYDKLNARNDNAIRGTMRPNKEAIKLADIAGKLIVEVKSGGMKAETANALMSKFMPVDKTVLDVIEGGSSTPSANSEEDPYANAEAPEEE